MTDIKVGDRVWYDDSPGVVVKVNGHEVTVLWDAWGLSDERRADLLTEAEKAELDD
jgi:hypothetical protein